MSESVQVERPYRGFMVEKKLITVFTELNHISELIYHFICK